MFGSSENKGSTFHMYKKTRHTNNCFSKVQLGLQRTTTKKFIINNNTHLGMLSQTQGYCHLQKSREMAPLGLHLEEPRAMDRMGGGCRLERHAGANVCNLVFAGR